MMFDMPDDMTPEEQKILNHIALDIYRHLDDPVDKLIVALCYELGYGKEACAFALSLSYGTIYKHDKELKEKLNKAYRVHVE